MTAPNAELAYRVLDHIDADPESWDQADWGRNTGCGTRACFAGWAVLLAGGEVQTDREGKWVSVTVDGERFGSVRNAAQQVLGIEDDEVPSTRRLCSCCDDVDDSCGLFDGTNTRVALGRFVEELFGPRPARPWTPDEKLPEGGTRVTVKRACNGCGELLGDVTDAEMDRAVAGLPSEDVRAECPRCRPGATS